MPAWLDKPDGIELCGFIFGSLPFKLHPFACGELHGDREADADVWRGVHERTRSSFGSSRVGVAGSKSRCAECAVDPTSIPLAE